VTVKEPEPAKERTLHMLVGSIKVIKIKGLEKNAWTIADEDIAELIGNKLNKVKAVKTGETVLTTTKDGKEYKILLTVEDITLSGNGLTRKNTNKNKYDLEMKTGESTQISYAYVTQPFFFKSNKPEVAFIDENGWINALGKGTVKFTAKVDGKTITVTVKVKK
ncbi:MAG: hypothetical protein IKS84_00565, partial [Lachnospiraceae bacterium]|nr:hypothetical protein [Lachnospiraceae bacterium]